MPIDMIKQNSNLSEEDFLKDNVLLDMLSNLEDYDLGEDALFSSEALDNSSEINISDNGIDGTDVNSHIFEFPDILPNGIIQCKIPNDEFIRLELKTERDSIIVINSKNEIYFYDKNSFCYYETPKDVVKYLSLNKDGHKKFLVLPSNLRMLMEQLGNINIYFLVIKDMDRLLYENSYKDNIEDIMDIYINEFNINNRCLFVNDYNIFTNPKLKEEARSNIKWHNLSSRNLRLYHIPIDKDEKGKSICNITGCIADIIKNLPKTDKVLVFYPSIKDMKQIALSLPCEMQEETCIVCSESNAKMAESFYSSAIDNRQTLSKRIVLWVNNDLNFRLQDKYHLLAVSDTRKGSTMLSLKSIHQLYQLNEVRANNILSDTIVYNTSYFLDSWSKQYDELMERADKIRQLYDSMDSISNKDNSLNKIFDIAKNVICHKAKGQLYGRFSPFELTRKGTDGKYYIAYMNFDSMKFRTSLIRELYTSSDILKDILSQYYTINEFKNYKKGVTSEQSSIKEDIKSLDRKIKKDEWLDALLDIEEKLNSIEDENIDLEDYIRQKLSKGNKVRKNLYKGFLKLYPYMDGIELVSLLKGIKCSTTTPLKNLNNSIIFWALEDVHPFKKAVMEAFPIGSQFTNEEIEDRLKPILHYHLHKDFPERSRKVIALFKSFLKADRPRTKYRVFLDDRYYNHKERIFREENDLLKYLQV